MSLSKLEIDYSPSQWSQRFSAAEIIEHYNNFIEKKSQYVRDNVPCELNHFYGKEVGQSLDIYGIHLPEGSPIFIFIHGGYWQEYSKNNSCYMAETFSNNGIKTIVIDFRICPRVSVNDQIDDVKRAIKYILNDLNKKYKTKNISIAGHSSGAHLIACLFDNFFTKGELNLIKSFFLICGIYDIVPIVNTYANDALKLTIEDAKNLSPQNYHVSLKKSKVFTVVAEFESPAFQNQSKLFFEKLKEDGENETHFLTIPETDHFNIVENLTEDNFVLTKLIFDSLLINY